jgi:hypothetical protein
MGPLNRRLRALERRLGDKDFKSGAPPVDADGMPCWGGSEPLSPDGYTRALGDLPDEDLTDEELETRARLSPYLALFKRLERDEKAGVGT